MLTNIISTKYFQFDQIWQNLSVPIATNKTQLQLLLKKYLNKKLETSPKKWKWAEKQFSNGKFDGQSAQRVIKFIENHI